MVKIDIGCGSHKHEGCVGIDIAPGPGVDYVLDITQDRLPFEDNSVEYVFSNHTFEHIVDPRNILREIIRVCKDGADVEIWTPYLKSNDAFVLGHTSFYNEHIWKHLCFEYDDFWFGDAPGRFELKKYHYVLFPGILQDLQIMHIPFSFALDHLFNVALEFGAFITVDKTRQHAKRPQYPEIYISYARHGEFTPAPTSLQDQVGVARRYGIRDYFKRLLRVSS